MPRKYVKKTRSKKPVMAKRPPPVRQVPKDRPTTRWIEGAAPDWLTLPH